MRRGHGLESYLNGLHARDTRVLVFHVPTAVQITGSRGRMVTGRKERAAWVDYSGMIQGGRAVALEAKETKAAGPSFPMSNVQPHQVERLRDAHNMGAISALYIRRRSGKSVDYLVPWPAIEAITAERKSLPWVQLEKWLIPVGDTWVVAALAWDAYLQVGWPR